MFTTCFCDARLTMARPYWLGAKPITTWNGSPSTDPSGKAKTTTDSAGPPKSRSAFGRRNGLGIVVWIHLFKLGYRGQMEDCKRVHGAAGTERGDRLRGRV